MNAQLPSERPLVFGVLNVTPDSFSDGGQYSNTDAAIARGRELARAGAHVIDVGGESTRPGATPVSRDEEQARVLPVITALAADGLTVSADTLHAGTAELAMRAGASIINDVSGGLADPNMYSVVRDTGALYIVGHWRGIPEPAHTRSTYRSVVSDVRAALHQRVTAAREQGVSAAQIIIDPGLGFDKTAAQGWEILSRFDALQTLGYPILVGISRKRMLAELVDRLPSQVQVTGVGTEDSRDLVTAVTSALLAQAGAWGIRVHHVPATVQALAVAQQFSACTPVGQTAPQAPPAPHNTATPVATPQNAPDRITLTGVEVFAHHGVFAHERTDGQRFLIDAELSLSLAGAASHDELDRTVHYGELAEAIVAAVKRDPVDLIETVAERIAQLAVAYPGVSEARITVHKPDAPITVPFGDVAVTVTRRPDESPRSAQ